MNNRSIEKTEAIAPIFRILEQKPEARDWKALSHQLMKYYGWEDLAYVLSQKRQDWRAIAEVFLIELERDATYIRVKKVLSALSDTPMEPHQLICDLDVTAVRQTLNSLENGGYSVPYISLASANGRPRKAYSKRA